MVLSFTKEMINQHFIPNQDRYSPFRTHMKLELSGSSHFHQLYSEWVWWPEHWMLSIWKFMLKDHLKWSHLCAIVIQVRLTPCIPEERKIAFKLPTGLVLFDVMYFISSHNRKIKYKQTVMWDITVFISIRLLCIEYIGLHPLKVESHTIFCEILQSLQVLLPVGNGL